MFYMIVLDFIDKLILNTELKLDLVMVVIFYDVPQLKN